MIRRYYAAVNRFDLEAATACFSQDAIYSHPAYPEGVAAEVKRSANGRVDVQGRDAILELLRARGNLNVSHEILTCVSDGEVYFVRGRATTEEGDAPFIMTLELSSDGLISNFTSYR